MTLQDEIRHYLNLCHGYAWSKAHPAKPDEPALVSAFLAEEMYEGLRDILRRHVSSSTKLLVRGIFTHQTPKVLPKGKTQSVEIGDLMIVHQHIPIASSKGVSGRAMLFQAKRARTTRTGSLAKGTEAIQFGLYQSWPEFTGETRLAPRPDLATPYWNFQNLSVNTQPATDGAEYLTVFKGQAYRTPLCFPQWTATISNGPDVRFVKKNYPNASTWSAGNCPPLPGSANNGVDCKNDFSGTFCDFLSGKKGRSFQPGLVSASSDHWSLFVNQMLAFAASPGYAYKLANQGIASSLRGRDLNFLAVTPLLYHASTEELTEFVATVTARTATTGFEVTNSLLDSIHWGTSLQGNDGRDFPPEYGAREASNNLPGGHVPMLLVITHGPDVLPFSFQS